MCKLRTSWKRERPEKVKSMVLRAGIVGLALVLFVEQGVADNNSGNNSRPRKPSLSQLEFDINNFKKKKPSPSPSPTPVAVVPVKIPDKKQVKSLHAEVEIYQETPDEMENYPTLLPRLREGPKTDKNDQDIISNFEVTWHRVGSDTCRHPGDETQFCQKSLAIKEILWRFSGYHEFYDSHCLRPCAKPEYKSVINHIVFDNPRGEELELQDSVKDCSYRLARMPGRPWMLLRPVSIECVCLPVKCGLIEKKTETN